MFVSVINRSISSYDNSIGVILDALVVNGCGTGRAVVIFRTDIFDVNRTTFYSITLFSH